MRFLAHGCAQTPLPEFLRIPCAEAPLVEFLRILVCSDTPTSLIGNVVSDAPEFWGSPAQKLL